MMHKKFRTAVKEARKMCTFVHNYQILCTVRVYDKKNCFDLKPFFVNLKTMEYEQVLLNLITCKEEHVNLKQCLEYMERCDKK